MNNKTWQLHRIIYRVETPGSALHRIYLNLYNSTFFPPDATRQLWLDASSPGSGFTLDDLFLHGMDTLPEFKSIKPWEVVSLVDSVYLDGGVGFPNFGTTGSGTVQSLTVVPEPATWPYSGLGWRVSVYTAGSAQLTVNPFKPAIVQRTQRMR